MINIRVLSKDEVEGQDFGEAFVLSIVSPGAEHPNFKSERQFMCQFNDIREDILLNSGIMNAMDKGMAEHIVGVVMGHRDVKEWVIHCEAGISRSPAVAIAFAKHLRCTLTANELKQMFPCYNRHVESAMSEALRKEIVRIVQNLRICLNFD